MIDPSSATKSLLELSFWRGIGPAKVRELARHLGSDQDIDLVQLLAKHFPKVQLPDPLERQQAASLATAVVEDCLQQSIRLLSVADDVFPAPLANIPDAPPLLYVRGAMEAVHKPCVAVVGTREASGRGTKAAFSMAQFLASQGVCTVSGLAFGIDAAAHRGALAGGGLTVAVLAQGVDKIAPAGNRPIGEELLEKGGALIGEHPPGTVARRSEFVRRNRIQSGLSAFSIIVESGEIGGAIHQARFTHQQGRQVYVFRPRGDAPGFRGDGAQYLIREFGARPIGGTGDLKAAIQAAQMSTAVSDQMELPL